MLPRPSRLTNSRDYRRAYVKGAHFFSKFLVLRKVANSLPKSRFGIVVTQKIDKRATERNKIKRRISEVIRLKLANINNGFDCALIVKKSIKNAKISEINKDITFLFKRSGLII